MKDDGCCDCDGGEVGAEKREVEVEGELMERKERVRAVKEGQRCRPLRLLPALVRAAAGSVQWGSAYAMCDAHSLESR